MKNIWNNKSHWALSMPITHNNHKHFLWQILFHFGLTHISPLLFW